MKRNFYLCLIAIFFSNSSVFSQITTLPNGGVSISGPYSTVTGPLPSIGSLLVFGTGGSSSAIQEDHGLNLCGSGIQPVRVFNSSLLVGYSSFGTDFGKGNAYISGKVGIGTTSPSSILTVNPNGAGQIIVGAGTTVIGSTNLSLGISSLNNGYCSVNSIQASGTLWGNLVLNEFGGNILIGKSVQTNSAYRLDINGGMRVNSVIVNATGADYVFDSKYQLPSLLMVEKYIIQNHHLPNIEPAKIMQEKGLNLGDNQIHLLAKIEELTLYLIQEEKQITSLRKQIEEKINIIHDQNQFQLKQQEHLDQIEKKMYAMFMQINCLSERVKVIQP